MTNEATPAGPASSEALCIAPQSARAVRPVTLQDACEQIDAMWRVGVRQEQRIIDLEAERDALRSAAAETNDFNTQLTEQMEAQSDEVRRLRAELERWSGLVREFVDFLGPMRFTRKSDDAKAAELDEMARAFLEEPNASH